MATVAVTANTANAGTLSACGISTSQYINYTVDGTHYVIGSVNPSAYLFAFVLPGGGSLVHGYQQTPGAPPGLGFSTPGATVHTCTGTFRVRIN